MIEIAYYLSRIGVPEFFLKERQFAHTISPAILITIFGTIGATFLSVSVIFLADVLLPEFSARFDNYAFATGIPLGVAPLLIYPLIWLNYRMEQAQAELARMAHTDVLTGVANRRGFFEDAETAFRRADERADARLAIMMVDIDHFKRVNDMYGHAVGDELLKRVACMLVETIKCARAEASWVVARIGGEEFAVLIMGAQAAEVVALAARICRHAPLAGVHVEGNFVRATVSIGIAMRGADQSLDAVMRSADKAAHMKRSAPDAIALSWRRPQTPANRWRHRRHRSGNCSARRMPPRSPIPLDPACPYRR